MSTKEQAKTNANVEAAIRSLYDLFPSITSCRNSRTPEVVAIERKIKARKDELAEDKKLAALLQQEKQIRANVKKTANSRRQEVDALLRRFRLRGVTDKLLSDIEALAAQSPIVICDYDCE
jgi:hypothetical protein